MIPAAMSVPPARSWTLPRAAPRSRVRSVTRTLSPQGEPPICSQVVEDQLSSGRAQGATVTSPTLAAPEILCSAACADSLLLRWCLAEAVAASFCKVEPFTLDMNWEASERLAITCSSHFQIESIMSLDVPSQPQRGESLGSRAGPRRRGQNSSSVTAEETSVQGATQNVKYLRGHFGSTQRVM